MNLSQTIWYDDTSSIEIHLSTSSDNCFSTFSQDIERYQIVNRSAIGQRRKLSIMIALIGDPKVRDAFSPTI